MTHSQLSDLVSHLYGVPRFVNLNALCRHELTRTCDLGSTWDMNWNEQVVPNMIISGTPCIDFSSSGACAGEYKTTGWMFSAQAESILLLSPNSFCIEMVANFLKVNGGRAFKSLVDQLETQYVIKHEVI